MQHFAALHGVSACTLYLWRRRLAAADSVALTGSTRLVAVDVIGALEPCVVFDFALDRGHEHVLDYLGPQISGYLVGDGYSGYGTIAKKRPGIIEAGCWAHALRKCREALKESPAGAAELLALVRTLFRIEVQAAEQNLDADGVKAARQMQSRPVLERLRERVHALRGWQAELSQQSALYEALVYIENQWEALNAFLEDGRVPIHNNSCERAIRPVAVGRKNWLFAGTTIARDTRYSRESTAPTPPPMVDTI